jgi:hypothetical protein
MFRPPTGVISLLPCMQETLSIKGTRCPVRLGPRRIWTTRIVRHSFRPMYADSKVTYFCLLQLYRSEKETKKEPSNNAPKPQTSTPGKMEAHISAHWQGLRPMRASKRKHTHPFRPKDKPYTYFLYTPPSAGFKLHGPSMTGSLRTTTLNPQSHSTFDTSGSVLVIALRLLLHNIHQLFLHGQPISTFSESREPLCTLRTRKAQLNHLYLHPL